MFRLFNRKSTIIILLFALVLIVSSAQDAGNNSLVSGQAVDGSIDDNNAARIYIFSASVGDTASLELTGQEDLQLTMLLSDEQGINLGQTQTVDASATLELQLAQAGNYYVTVFPSMIAENSTTGTFNLTLTLSTIPGTLQPSSFTQGQVNLLNGLNINLSWDTRDDLNLQIRTPAGETLFWDSRTTADGGTFGPDLNGLCETLTEPPAVETASWQGGALATGSYEILVYYRQSCENTGNSVEFSVDVTVDGVALDTINGIVPPPSNNTSSVFISSFTINADGTASIGNMGPYLDTSVLPVDVQEVLSSDSPSLAVDTPVEGIITNSQPWQTYSFAGRSGQLIAISLSKIQGNLDTVLLVLDSLGNVIASNDDAQSIVNTDSLISGLRLPTDDTYTIVATRYGKDVGGTEGTYELLISASNVPQPLLDLDLPPGDIEITLVWNTQADLQLLVRDPFGNSVYDDTPRVQSGGILAATGNINCSISESEPVYYIYWPEGLKRPGSYEVEVWYQSDCGDFNPVTFTLYIVVDGQLIFTNTGPIEFLQKYLTSFTIDSSGAALGDVGGIIGGSETLNYQERLPSAFSITSGDSVTGSISPTNKFDLYTFEGQAGDVVRIAMSQVSGTLDTLLFLIDPNGVEIASNDDANESTNSLIGNVRLTQDGTYTIVATHFGTIYGGTIGAYDLTFRIDR